MEKPLTKHIKPDGSQLILKNYVQDGGYLAVRKVLKEMSPATVTDVVIASNLLGRGGGGFPAGKKWSFVPPDNVTEPSRYLI